MNPYTRTFHLQQHTPIIHFQWEQQGALLRATELKPKFDKFIHSQIKDIPLNWYVGGRNKKKKSIKDLNHLALDYKMRIVQRGKIESRIIQKNDSFPPMFFGNMGNEYIGKEKSLQMTRLEIQLDLVCMNSELVKVLGDLFPKFLAQTNVGTRQNKGFGSFYLKNSGKGQDIKTLFPHTPYLQISSNKLDQILTTINYYYQRLKSGVNFKDHYQKSGLSQSLDGITWEKPWVKDRFIGDIKLPPKDYRFARALLGLPGSFTYKPNDRGQRPPYPRYETEITIEDKSEKIARIKSPITFKPIIDGRETKIFIFIRDYTEAEKKILADTTFTFSGNGITPTLRLPSRDQFPDLHKLLAAYHQELGHSFEARDYTGRMKVNVKIHPWEGAPGPTKRRENQITDILDSDIADKLKGFNI